MFSFKRSIAMPAIYNFHGSEEFTQTQNTWGWHNARELLEAVNAILVQQGAEELTAMQIGQQFSFVDPMVTTKTVLGLVPVYYVIMSSGQMMSCSCSKGQWLESAVKHDEHIPAQLGMALIKAVKQPRKSAILRALAPL